MEWIGAILRRLGYLIRRGRFDRELQEEMRFHLEMKAQCCRDSGMNPTEARHAALRGFGNTALIEENTRNAWGWRWLEDLLRDLTYGIRGLRRSPGFTAIAVLSLALGIGANTAIFTFIDAILLRPLPVRDPDRLVSIYHRNQAEGWYSSSSYPDFEFYRSHSREFSGMLAYIRVPMIFRAGAGAEQAPGELVSPGYFDVLGIAAERGRTFRSDETAAAVLSHGLWERRFGSDPKVIGRQIVIGRQPVTVIGIAPREFRGLVLDWQKPPDIWVPVSAYKDAVPALREIDVLHYWGMQSFLVAGRLRPGATLDQARAEMDVLAARAQIERSAAVKQDWRFGVVLFPAGQAKFWPAYRSSVMGFLGMLAAAVGLVLLIACFNLASLMLARSAGRQREMAVRQALGAGRMRLARQLVAESLLIAFAGCAAGLLMARWSAAVLASFHQPFRIPMAVDTTMDARVFWFAVALSAVTALVFGLLPAREASRIDLVHALKADSGVARGRFRRFRSRDVLVAAQIALSILLLAGAGLFLRTLANARAADPTTDPGNVLLTRLELATLGYDDKRCALFYPQVLERVGNLPGVKSAALVSIVPLGGMRGGTDIRIRPPGEPAERRIQTDYNVVSAGYFDTVGLPVVAGRPFEAIDRAGSAPVAIVNEMMVRRYWPGENPIGKSFSLLWPGTGVVEVVGVVRDGRFRNYREPVRPCFYLPLGQHPRIDMSLEVRTAGQPLLVARAVREQIQALDREAAPEFLTLQSHREMGLSQERFTATLLAGLALLALVLVVIGVYGVISFMVARRTREIGIRIALGARPSRVLRLALGRSLILVMSGLAAGLAAALACGRFVSGRLYGVTPADPLTLAGVSALLVAVALAAAYIPARRATRIDPVLALRQE